MMNDKNIPLVPKKTGGPLKVTILGRLSRPKPDEEDTQLTIESSFQSAREYLYRRYKGPIEFRELGEQISGMVVNRRTVVELYELVEHGDCDLVLTEELSRVHRNPRHQYAFVQDMVDFGQRFISIADNLDTADENWETMLAVAAVRHGLTVPDTGRRIRRKAKTAFHAGGMVMKVRFGFRKLTKDEAKSGEFGPPRLRIAKQPDATPVWAEIRRRVIESKSPTRVVEWLKSEQIQPGRYVKSRKWTVPVLKLAMCDPLLHGTRIFWRTMFMRLYKTGKYKRKPNPEPELEYIPGLAHMSRQDQETMLAAVGWEIDWGGTRTQKPSPRRNIPRRCSLWPGRAAICGACRGEMVISGDHLRCPRCLKSHGRTCWNRVEVPLEITRRKIAAWLNEQLDRYPTARDAFVEAAWQEVQRTHSLAKGHRSSREARIASLELQGKRLANAIALGGEFEALVTSLAGIQTDLDKLRAIQSSEDEAHAGSTSYLSKADVDRCIGEVILELMRTSFEFNDVMRKEFLEFVIQPVQALDSGQVHPRAKLRFKPDPVGRPQDLVEVAFDLFEPPIHIKLLSEVVEARQKINPKTNRPAGYRAVALDVGAGYMTVKRSLRYAKLMEAAGTTDQFCELTERPEKASRWRERDLTSRDNAA